MSEIHKTYRIRTDVGVEQGSKYITLDANLVQDYDVFDILSVKINSVDTYKLHNANYGVVVGRVLANNGFGIPNAKLSIFISADGDDGDKIRELYPFSNTTSKDKNGVRYNLLPDEKINDCHQIVGTFPNKRYALDNDVILEVFDKYYKYTTRTNNAGDYLFMGVPVGTHTLHMDLDLSDCGILSQKPRDFVYKGYTVEQFENPNMFKDGTAYSNLSQIFTQDQVVNVQPFWGNASLGEKIGITRADIDVAFKFEPTCVFIGSVISDNSSQGISKKCIPTENMGNMEELTTGEGTIEMIRKTHGGSVEEFQVKGTQLIDGNGIWCYQIPMNLDYMMTDEYGNMVPTDDPEKGIPTRTKVRFRVSMQDNEENVDNYFRAKVLVPHNPQNLDDGKYEGYDYEFGSLTRDDSFRDLFWNNVYSVKSYIPRFQKRKVGGWKEKKFTGIKNCNFYGPNNPMPYNNIRIKLPFMFTVMCALIKVFIFIVSIMNSLTSMLGNFLCDLGDTYIGFHIWKWDVGFYPFKKLYKKSLDLSMNVIKEGLCPDLENWYFAPMFKNNLWSSSKRPPKGMQQYDLLNQTLAKIRDASADDDMQSIDYQNNEEMDSKGEEPVCLTIHTDYLISCVEMNLAMEYKVINFDFYNDWVNGTLYFPRFMRYVRPKKTFLGITFARSKVKGCMDDSKIFSNTRRYTQQCALGYKNSTINGKNVYTNVENPLQKKKNIKIANNLHKQRGLTQKTIFGKNGGICHEQATLRGQYVYYMKPCEWTYGTTPNARKVNLFATDLILLGSLNDCDLNGYPQAFKYLSSSSYIMPTNLALTNMENNGYLYTTEKGSICAGKSQLTASDVENGSRIRALSPSDGLLNEIKAFSGAQDFNYNVRYDGNELSDIIALTEAAGIAWNYTGPGQGEIVPEKLYYPGGHFLGLSCVNSQTNIKSCINLSRICEIGANMSQRKEDVSGIDENGKLTYTYTVPTGFISGDDIIGGDFRTMFATLNHKRLIATKTNPATGYKIYDLDFVKPINFDGAFQNVISNDNGLYNSYIDLPNELDENKKTLWEAIGIDYNVDSRPDYDPDELANTQTRTIEETSIDYYLYRFGLDYNELKKSNQKHLRRFLITDGNKMYLPQYENSYYFYFGLKNGATAIDEFNKQFFSECANGMLLSEEPMVNINIDGEIDINNGKVVLNVSTNNLEAPYQYIEIESDVDFIPGGGKSLIVKNGDDEDTYDHWLTNYMFTLGEENSPWQCPFGTYTVTIRDANDVVYSRTEKIGMNLLSFESVAYDFNTLEDEDEENLIYRGGYVSVSNVKIDGLPDGEKLDIVLKSTNINNDFSATHKIDNGKSEVINLMVEEHGEYALYVKYGNDVEMFMQTIIIRNTSDLKLYMGDPDLYHEEMTHEKFPYNWWIDGLNGDDNWARRLSTFNEVTNRQEDASTIKVYAVGGTKVVWGLPQNSEGIDVSNGVCSSENVIEWPQNTTVDDEYVHYPTYTYNGSGVSHFSALVYDGERVMGNYDVKLINGQIDNSGSTKINDLQDKTGWGYIFKPIPDGDLQFHVYDGSYKYNEKDENGEDIKIKNGVFYPSISYPSVDRSFYAKARFYCWERRAIEMIADEGGKQTPSIMDYEEGGKTEITIYNGITYGDKFFTLTEEEEIKNNISSTYITNLENLKKEKDFTTNRSDMDGVQAGENRETHYSGYNDNVTFEGKNVQYISGGESGITTYYYEIFGGADKEENAKMVNSIYDSTESLFAEYVTFAVNDKRQVVGPFPVGGVNNNGLVKYYMALDDGTLLQQTDRKYLYVEEGKKTNYLYCTYTSASTYDAEGEPVMVTITVDDRKRPDKANCTFNRKDASGATYEYSKTKIKIDNNNDDNDIEVFEVVFNNVPEIEGVKDYRIKKLEDNTDLETILIEGRSRFEGNKYYQSTKAFYAYGVINGENDTKLYKIYPIVTKINNIQEDFMADIEISPSTLDVDKYGTVGADFTIEADEKKSWGVNKAVDWVSLEPENGIGNGNFHVIVEPNYGTSSRSCTISFHYANEDISEENTKLVINQEAGDGGTGATECIREEYIPQTYTKVDEKVESNDSPTVINSNILYEFDFRDIEGRVGVACPSLKVNKFEFNRGIPGAENDCLMDIRFKIASQTNGYTYATSFISGINEEGTYSTKSMLEFIPNTNDGKYVLYAECTIHCTNTYSEAPQTVTCSFETTDEGLYYKYFG